MENVRWKPGITVALADGNDVHRAGLVALLKREDDISIVGESRSGLGALQFLEARRPAVLICEARLPDMTGAALCSQATQIQRHLNVLVLSDLLEDNTIHACLVVGVRGYVTKDSSGPDIVDAVRRVARGESILAPAALERVIEWARRARTLHSDSQMLTQVELMALSLAAEGLSTRAMAVRLNVGITTAKQYLKSAMRKLGATQRAEAVATGIRRGVI